MTPSTATMLTVTAASLAAGTGSAAQVSVSGKECEVTRILKDGRQIRSTAKADGSAQASAAGRASAASVSSATGSSRSSVSVSSSSNGGGSARATSSVTDAEGRTVTTTHDENGCTIVIDERGS